MSAFSQSSIPNAVLNQPQNLRVQHQYASQNLNSENQRSNIENPGYLKYDNNWTIGTPPNRRVSPGKHTSTSLLPMSLLLNNNPPQITKNAYNISSQIEPQRSSQPQIYQKNIQQFEAQNLPQQQQQQPQQSPKKQSTLNNFQQTKSKSFDAPTFHSNMTERKISVIKF